MTELGGEATRYLAMSNPSKPTISTTDARSAIAHYGVRHVLAISVVLAIAAMIIAYVVA